MIRQAQKEGKNVVRIEMEGTLENVMDTVHALLNVVGLADREVPLTPDELYWISQLIAAMLPKADQINNSANYQEKQEALTY
jgi:hypothetical protein